MTRDMKPENRARMVDAVGQLREVRGRMVAIARRQKALDNAAAEHRQAVRGDMEALLSQEGKAFDQLTAVLEAETLADDEARSLYGRIRFGLF